MITLDEVQAAGGYSVIYADPPWSYGDKLGARGAEAHYPVLKPDEIKALPINRLAAKDAVLFLWAVYPQLPLALDVIRAWGFTYKTIAFQWCKSRSRRETFEPGQEMFGLGRWTRGNTEPCLLAVRGDPPRPMDNGVRQVVWSFDDGFGVEELVVAPVGEHSAKPTEVRDRIVRLMGEDLARIELFARARAPGWDAWGNEVPSDVDMLTRNARVRWSAKFLHSCGYDATHPSWRRRGSIVGAEQGLLQVQWDDDPGHTILIHDHAVVRVGTPEDSVRPITRPPPGYHL